MPKTHVCPESICERFRGGEEDKSDARTEAVRWLRAQSIDVGDTVLMPDSYGDNQPFIAEKPVRPSH